MKADSPYYRTSDLYIASALLTMGVEFRRIQPNERYSQKWNFVFSDSPRCQEIVAKFLNASLEVNLRAYLYNWRHLRRQLDGKENVEMSYEKNTRLQR
jgi:hypothetical protein